MAFHNLQAFLKHGLFEKDPMLLGTFMTFTRKINCYSKSESSSD